MNGRFRRNSSVPSKGNNWRHSSNKSAGYPTQASLFHLDAVRRCCCGAAQPPLSRFSKEPVPARVPAPPFLSKFLRPPLRQRPCLSMRKQYILASQSNRTRQISECRVPTSFFTSSARYKPLSPRLPGTKPFFLPEYQVYHSGVPP